MKIKKIFVLALIVGMSLLNINGVYAAENNIEKNNARYTETYTVTDTISLGSQGHVDVKLNVTHITNNNRYSLNSVSHTTHFDSGIVGLQEVSFSTNPSAGSNLSGRSVTVKLKYKNILTSQYWTKKQAISV